MRRSRTPFWLVAPLCTFLTRNRRLLASSRFHYVRISQLPQINLSGKNTFQESLHRTLTLQSLSIAPPNRNNDRKLQTLSVLRVKLPLRQAAPAIRTSICLQLRVATSRCRGLFRTSFSRSRALLEVAFPQPMGLVNGRWSRWGKARAAAGCESLSTGRSHRAQGCE